MIFALHQTNAFLRHSAINLAGMILVVITLSVVWPVVLLMVIIGAASAGACALGSPWINDDNARAHFPVWMIEKLRTTLKRRTTRKSKKIETGKHNGVSETIH
jgi:hypothetical protein